MKKFLIFMLPLLLLKNLTFSGIDEDLQNYLQFYQKDPQNKEILLKIATLYKEKREYTKAIDFFNLCISKEPDNYYYYYQVAECYKLRGRLDKAFDTVTNALFYFENNQKLKILYGDILFDMGMVKRALEIYLQLAEKIENSKELSKLYLRIGKCYLEVKNYKESENYLLNSLKIKEDSWTFYYLSKLYEEMKSFDKAIWAIKKAMAYRTKDDKLQKEIYTKKLAGLLYKKGLYLKENGDNTNALATFFQIVSNPNTKDTIYFERANYWVKRLER